MRRSGADRATKRELPMKAKSVVVMVCGLFLVAVIAGWAAGQTAPAPAPMLPTPAGLETTVKGVLFSSWNYYKHQMPLNQSPKGSREKFELVLYAFDGPNVKATFDEMMARFFPAGGGGMDAEHATALQKEFDDKLRYYPDTGDEKAQAKLVYDWTWIPALATVTGIVQEKDGRKMLLNAKVTIENPKNASFKYPPDCMLQPDKPLAMPKEKPVDIKVTDALALKCVPIPPGTFIMGSPFYQLPRYQDECPHEVVLTKTFYLAEIPVTQEMWDAVMGADKDRSRHKGPKCAVEFAPFPDIREFCRILSEKNGRKVRVPTAAEMDYVGRLGNSSPCFQPKYASQRTNVGNAVVDVKTGRPSPWGIYDYPAWAVHAVSDWKAPNRPDKQVDPQGEPFESSWVYYDHAILAALKLDKPVEGMIMKGPFPAIHKGTNGFDRDRPNQHDRYGEDGLDGGNGRSWIGIFRVAVDAEPAAAPK